MNTSMEHLELPLMLRLVNRLGTAGRRLRIPFVDLSEASLMGAAKRATGLSDWGGEEFRTPLRILLEGYEREADLTTIGRLAVRRECLQVLCNRLQIQEDLKRHPEILEVPIRCPLYIVGFPRTGTTLLHSLLGQDPAARVPLMWELRQPSPPPNRETRSSDPRIALTDKQQEQFLNIVPHFRAIHPMGAERPDECVMLFRNSFASVIFEATAHLPSYTRWLLGHDMLEDYRYYRRQLQLLMWRSPGDHWALKAPAHLLWLRTLFDVFPDACVIQTHRDPRKVAASCCSLFAAIRSIHTDTVDLKQLGQDWLHTYGTAMDRAMEARRQIEPGRILDVGYRTLFQDPIGTVKRIYDHFGYTCSPEMEAGMRRWLAANPQDAHGRHQYSLDQFGLTEEQLDQRFQSYRDAFGALL